MNQKLIDFLKEKNTKLVIGYMKMNGTFVISVLEYDAKVTLCEQELMDINLLNPIIENLIDEARNNKI